MANDPYAKRLLWFVFAGSRGGLNRLKLVKAIRENPLNANQLAKEMSLDYKAIIHHIGVLEKITLHALIYFFPVSEQFRQRTQCLPPRNLI